ncbi:MAG: hypothetical protein M0R33_09320 [Methylomonas sp.]|jgi:hypothetical protein|uniref:hypothetical protein n=1 Tax=Methylomonas sp. TaxID=418 RepID=UPI0025F1091C|nr:hypothetical protein [Methylomonas sp.]MCK9606635.1 hypothetical protein [Methylomonas sp.]
MFLPERGSIGLKTSDLSFEENSAYGLCEVKTIGVSDEELDRYEKGEVFSTTVYRELGEGFFNKLGSLIENALEKMQEPIEKKLIFFVVHFDDHALYFFSTYEKEIKRFVGLKYPSIEIYFQMALNVDKRIHYIPQKFS